MGYYTQAVSAELTTVDAAILTVPSGSVAVLQHLFVFNKTTTQRTVSVSVTRTAGPATTTHITALPVPANNTIPGAAGVRLYQLENLALGPGDSINALASANSALHYSATFEVRT